MEEKEMPIWMAIIYYLVNISVILFVLYLLYSAFQGIGNHTQRDNSENHFCEWKLQSKSWTDFYTLTIDCKHGYFVRGPESYFPEFRGVEVGGKVKTSYWVNK